MKFIYVLLIFSLMVAPALAACPDSMAGTGTYGDPCVITNWTNLNKTRTQLTYNYSLGNDIDSTTAGYIGLGNVWSPIGTYEVPFVGSLQGNHFTISNLSAFGEMANYGGLFGAISSTTKLYNINLNVNNVSGKIAVGSLSGYTFSSSEIKNSTVTIYGKLNTSNSAFNTMTGGIVGSSAGVIDNCTVTIYGEIDGVRTGGMIGYAADAPVTNSNVTIKSGGKISAFNLSSGDGKASAGGFIGYGGNENNCYVLAEAGSTITSVDYAGAFTGYIHTSDSLTNSYSILENTSVLNGDDYVGLIGFYNATGYVGTISNDNLVIRTPNIGNITFLTWNVTGTGSLTNKIYITNNSATVNSTDNPGFNRSANITFTNIGRSFTNPVIYRDGYNVCTSATTPSCYNYTSLNASTVTFNVSAWSTYYTIDESQCVEISTPIEYTMTANVNYEGAGGRCIRVTSDDVTVNCDGFTITGSGNVPSAGVFSYLHDNVKIKNCIINNFYEGIYLVSDTNINLTNNTLSSNYVGTLLTVSDGVVNNNTFDSNTADGLEMGTCHNLLITNNIFSNNGMSGISLETLSHDVTVSSNTAYTNGGAGFDTISGGSGSPENNTFSSNIAYDNFWGFAVIESSRYNNFTSNKVYQNDYGFFVNESSENLFTTNNATDNTYDFFIGTNAFTNTIINLRSYQNNISFTGNDVWLKGIIGDLTDLTNYHNISKYVNATNNSATSWLFLNFSYLTSDWDSTGILNESSISVFKNSGGTWYTPSNFSNIHGIDTTNNIVWANITNFSSTFVPMGSLTNTFTACSINWTYDIRYIQSSAAPTITNPLVQILFWLVAIVLLVVALYMIIQ